MGLDRRNMEKTIGRYMQEIRDIVKARLSRRELLRMGLVSGSSGLLALYGLRHFKPYWGHAQLFADELQLQSPPNTPFKDPLPIPQPLQTTTLSPAPTKGTNPVASAVTGFTEAVRPDHQRWTAFGGQSDTAPGFTGPQYEIIEQAVEHDFYPVSDKVPPSTIWTFVDATNRNTGPLRINAHYGQPAVVRIHNDLPEENNGFGINQTSTHLHNGHTASESDGGPTHFYDAKQFKDFHYPNVRAGFASTHPTSTLNGVVVPGDVRETMSFLWFHDHRFDFTSQNVYKGLVDFYTLFSDDIQLDTGNETTGLRLPSGPYDIPMVFADKVFDPTTGELFFDLFNLDGILGDKYTVNGKIQPFLEVQRRKYRFRFLNGGPSRVYEFFLSNGQPFFQLSNDGNLLPRTLQRQSIRVGVAERVDVIVDFSKATKGDKIYLQNRLEQVNGRGPTGKIIAPTNLVEFRVGDAAQDDSQIPTTLLALPDRRATAQSRRWDFGRSGGEWVINGELFDPDVIRVRLQQNTAELWTFTGGNGWQHPVHVHMEEFQILSRNGKAQAVPIDEKARKDVIRIGDSAVGTEGIGESQIFIQFRDFHGDYPLHCHNTVHEDHSMMVRFEVVEPKG
jgi:FtsP/CotA-like multicopper oxidase with cupredoxin domain